MGEEDSSLVPYSIILSGADMTLELLIQKLKNSEIEIPDFQRHYVWPIKRASRLIESFLLGLPVPQIFLYRDKSTEKLIVVDGQQRLRTVEAFFNGKYHERQFKLDGVNPRWINKTYADFSDADK